MTIHDFTERRQFRKRETVSAVDNSAGYYYIDIERIAAGSSSLPPGEIHCGSSVVEYECHTTNEAPLRPTWELVHDLQARLEHASAKYWGLFVLGLALGVCFGYWVLPGWVH